MRYFLEFSYAGTYYHGWQRQPNAVSIQETMEDMLTTFFKNPTPLVAAGRTDTGVHAQQMFAHFQVINPIQDHIEWLYKANKFLPNDIAVHRLHTVNDEAHARFDANSRTYQYYIKNKKSPFQNELHYCLYQDLNLDKIKKASQIIMEYEDFECFSKSNTGVKTYLCKISSAKWEKTKNGYIFTITANRFLRNMVRAIVGTLIEIGLNRKTVEDFQNIIQSKNRSEAGFSVPAKGLFLTQITYPKSIFIK